jgi:enoyl-CoA hydratase
MAEPRRTVLSAPERLVWIERKADEPTALVLGGPKGNALSPEFVDALSAAIEELATVREVVVIVRSESPRAFMVGGDLDVFATWAADGVLAERWSALAAQAGGALARLRDLPVVKIALLQGAAVGGGLELALMCDYRIAASEVRLGFPEVRMGVYPAGGGVPRLAEAIGRGPALRMLLGGRLVGAERALEMGLVDEVLAAEEVQARGLALAAEIGGADPAVVAAVRRALAPGIATDEIAETMDGLLRFVPAVELAVRIEAQRAGRRAPTSR